MASKRLKRVDVFPKVVEETSPVLPSPTDLYAALDLGTNSCRMLIAQSKGSQFHVVDSFSRTVQLGSGLERSGRLSRASMYRTIQALRVCKQKLKNGTIFFCGCRLIAFFYNITLYQTNFLYWAKLVDSVNRLQLPADLVIPVNQLLSNLSPL